MSKIIRFFLLLLLQFFSFSQAKGQQFDKFPLHDNPIMLERAVRLPPVAPCIS